jgi:hypothetical protein
MSNAKERGIIMQPESSRLIIRELKTQTRRVVMPFPRYDKKAVWLAPADRDSNFLPWPDDRSHVTWDDILAHTDYYVDVGYCPYGKPLDRLWVKEKWRMPNSYDDHSPSAIGKKVDEARLRKSNLPIEYDWGQVNWRGERPGRWRSPLHMPRWASRVTVVIEEIRIERIQEISHYGAIREGAQGKASFMALWEKINGDREGCDWDSDPFVWVISFRKVGT